jgi:hypothetical protein
VKPLPRVVVLALVALPLAACGESCRRQGAAMLGFEGEIELRTSSPGIATTTPTTTTTTVFRVKGDRLRCEVSMAPVSFVYIIDSSRRVSYLVDNTGKSYTKIAMKDPAPDASAPGATPPARRKVGTAVVAGHPCTLYESSTTTGTTTVRAEVCTADDLGSPMLGPVGKLFGAGPMTLFGGGTGFPLRMRTFDGSGALLYSMEATRVENKSEPDSLFEPPPGYTESDAGIF